MHTYGAMPYGTFYFGVGLLSFELLVVMMTTRGGRHVVTLSLIDWKSVHLETGEGEGRELVERPLLL